MGAIWLSTLLATFVLLPVAIVLFTAGSVALISSKGPLPGAITRRLPREPASRGDHRLQGLSFALFGTGMVVLVLNFHEITTQGLADPSPAIQFFTEQLAMLALTFLFLGVVAGLSVRQRDHKTSEVLSGWEQMARVFRG